MTLRNGRLRDTSTQEEDTQWTERVGGSATGGVWRQKQWDLLALNNVFLAALLAFFLWKWPYLAYSLSVIFYHCSCEHIPVVQILALDQK